LPAAPSPESVAYAAAAVHSAAALPDAQQARCVAAAAATDDSSRGEPVPDDSQVEPALVDWVQLGSAPGGSVPFDSVPGGYWVEPRADDPFAPVARPDDSRAPVDSVDSVPADCWVEQRVNDRRVPAAPLDDYSVARPLVDCWAPVDYLDDSVVPHFQRAARSPPEDLQTDLPADYPPVFPGVAFPA
jgi:hypothetical protein